MTDSAASSNALAVEYRTVGSLKPDPRNARTHPKRQLEQIKASIKEFGFTNPVLIDEQSAIIAGHGRLRAAKEAGLEEVPTIVLAGLTDGQKRALRLADNKIALGASWDLDLLKLEFGDLADMNFDLGLTGFSAGEIDIVLLGANDPDDDHLPEIKSTPRTRPDDIWILGDHRLGCGDGRDRAFLRRVIGKGVKIDAAFLDPPYNVAIGGHANTRGRHREFAMASGEMSGDEFRTFLTDALGACVAASRDGAVHFVCMDWRHMDDLSGIGRGVYGDLLNLCIWNKSNAGMGSLYRSKHELIFVYRVGQAPVPSIYSIVPPNDGSALRHGHHFEPVDFVIDHGRGHHDAYSAGSCQRIYARACGCRQRPRCHREELIQSERGWSGREAFVTMMQTADLGQGNDRSRPGRLNGSSIRCVLAERQVGP